MFEDDSTLMTVDDLCEPLMIGKGVAYKLLKSGKIKCFRINKIWKIPKKSLAEYINNQCMNNGKNSL